MEEKIDRCTKGPITTEPLRQCLLVDVFSRTIEYISNFVGYRHIENPYITGNLLMVRKYKVGPKVLLRKKL
jgi:hypothetical protein